MHRFLHVIKTKKNPNPICLARKSHRVVDGSVKY